MPTNDTDPLPAPISAPAPGRSWLAPALVAGWATAVGMWLVAFFGHLPGLDLHPAGLAVAMLLVQGLGMMRAGRWASARPVRAGLVAGLVTSALNLMILGSSLVEAPRPGLEGLVPNAGIFVSGFFALGAGLGVIGGLAGASLTRRPSATTQDPAPGRAARPAPDWLARFAVVAVVAISPLLLVGGLVTSKQAGMAVPDWPTSFSANMFLYPLSQMSGGVYYEHTHRLFGSLVGLTLLTLAVWTIATRGVRGGAATKWAVGILFVAVCIQGLLGGQRVNLDSLSLAMIHGVGGQMIFAATVALAVVLTPFWWRGADGGRGPDARGPAAGAGATEPAASAPAAVLHPPVSVLLSWALVASLLVQLVFGAMYRHLQSSHALLSHVTFAIVVLALALFVGLRCGRARATPGPVGRLGRLGAGLTHTVLAQFALGIAALLAVTIFAPETPAAGPSWADVVFSTLHQFNGAVLLGLATLVATASSILARRSTAGAPDAARPATALPPTRGTALA